MKYIELLLKLNDLLGYRMKEALPLILALIKIFTKPTETSAEGAVSYSMPAEPSEDYKKFIKDAVVCYGADESQAHELAQLVRE